MAEITIKGQTYSLSEFEGLEGSELDQKLLSLKGVGPKTLEDVRVEVLSALADQILEMAESRCRNFEKCGNQAEEGHAYCSPCHLKWRTEEAKREDRETRPIRVDVEERLERSREFYARYYKGADPAKWPNEVSEAFLAAENSLAEGDQNAITAMVEGDPNPGLFKVARAHYYLVKNHLSLAEYHSARISAKGVLRGLSGLARRQVEKAMSEAEKAMAATKKLEGFKRTRQLRDAARAMRNALTLARKERESLNKEDADSFYGGTVGDFLSDEQAKKLERRARRQQKKARGE